MPPASLSPSCQQGEEQGTGGSNTPPTPTTTPSPTAKKTYAGAAQDAPANAPPADREFTKVNKQKKKGSPHLFAMAYSKINRQVNIKTNGGPVQGAINDAIPTAINAVTAHHNIQLLAAEASDSGNITLETHPNTSADEGSALPLEITAALDSLNVMVDKIYANSHWTHCVLHRLPTTPETWNRRGNCKETSAAIAAEIERATGFTLAQPPQWLTPVSKRNDQDRGLVKVSFPGKSVTLDTTTVFCLIDAVVSRPPSTPPPPPGNLSVARASGTDRNDTKAHPSGEFAPAPAPQTFTLATAMGAPESSIVTTLPSDAPTALWAQAPTTKPWTVPAPSASRF